VVATRWSAVGAVNDLISVIVSTYNRADALDAVLRSLSRQDDGDFEIVVADDGSGPTTAAVVRKWAETDRLRVKHIWHEDQGFRPAAIRNRGILASSGKYVVFLDGDCIAPPDFVASHRRLAEAGWFVAGSRVLLSPALTDRILAEGLEPEAWLFPQWLRSRWRGEINRLAPLIRVRLGAIRKLSHRRWRGARSSNMAIWRTDLDRVDGFDATYTGWGREDSDLLIRLIRAGVRRKDGLFAGGVLHLWHRNADRSHLAENDRQLQDVLRSKRLAARCGLSCLAEKPAVADTIEGSP
jgi:glycosyltransferase involved in cell wall biosynthesis